MDAFSRNRSRSCPGNWNFWKISGWVFQDLPMRVNGMSNLEIWNIFWKTYSICSCVGCSFGGLNIRYAKKVLAIDTTRIPTLSIIWVMAPVTPNRTAFDMIRRPARHADEQKFVPYIPQMIYAFFEMNFMHFSIHHMQHLRQHIKAVVNLFWCFLDFLSK